MNEAFDGVFVREDVSQPLPNPDNIFQGPKVENVPITRYIKKRLDEIIVNKATGSDGVSLPYIPDYKMRFFAKFKASKSKGRLIH